MPVKLMMRRDGVVLLLKVVPGARRDRIVGELGEALKVAVSKPPEGGAANAAVITLLSETLRISAASLQIIKGHTAPRKQVLIRGLDRMELERRLHTAMSQA